jgi:hypothetical protein
MIRLASRIEKMDWSWAGIFIPKVVRLPFLVILGGLNLRERQKAIKGLGDPALFVLY